MRGTDSPDDVPTIEGAVENIDVDWTLETASAAVIAVAELLSRVDPDVNPGAFIKSDHIESEDADSHVEVINPDSDAEVSLKEAGRN